MPEPGEFFGRPEEYLAWAAENPSPPGAMFCTRHWMPCPVEGKNGVMASVLLSQEAIELIPDRVKALGAEAMNAWLHTQSRLPCCQLGDEKMEELWGKC